MTESQAKLQINPKKYPKWCKILILALPVLISFFQLRLADNDFYFLHATGEYIVKHGFPYTDMLSMHSSMKIVVQQWLSSVIFYYSYQFLGAYGAIILLYVFSVIVLFLTYRLGMAITGNEIISAPVAAIVNILLFDPFMVTRPQIFTYAILLGEVILLEKYVQTVKIKYLIGIPVMSLLLINLHAAMWPMLLVLMVPYIISAVPLNTKAIKREPTGDLLMLLAIFVVSIVIGLLNPYGVENMIYLFKSYGRGGLDVINEMKPTNFGTTEGKTFFGVVGACVLLLFFVKKQSVPIRFFLLFAGTTLLGLMQIKGIPYALFIGIPAFTYVLKDFKLTSITEPLKKIVTKRIKVLVCIFVILGVILSCEGRYLTTDDIRKSNLTHYENLYGAVQMLNEVEEPIVLYSNFNDGQYFEFFGYHPYIDGRAELFLASNNNEFDYFGEYLLMLNGNIYYKDFLDRYQFNYLAVSKGLDHYLYSALLLDEEYEQIYDSSDVALFVKK